MAKTKEELNSLKEEDLEAVTGGYIPSSDEEFTFTLPDPSESPVTPKEEAPRCPKDFSRTYGDCMAGYCPFRDEEERHCSFFNMHIPLYMHP